MKITIDKEKCIGCGACVSICPESFEMSGDKAIVKKKTIKKATCEQDAADSCPTAAIKISR